MTFVTTCVVAEWATKFFDAKGMLPAMARFASPRGPCDVRSWPQADSEPHGAISLMIDNAMNDSRR
jgi:hypothetical protein